MPIISTKDGDDEFGVVGNFADRLQYAIYSSVQHLYGLIQYTAAQPGVGHTSCDALQADISKPQPEESDLPYQLLNA
ncbi:hypothetical protein J7E62_27515 [Variovorax paradoxus]|nr:hypothetical protein [Variovorax paradoxus]